MYKRILVPLDGSGLSEQVLPYVQALRKAFGSHIELLRIVPARHQHEIVPSESPEDSSGVNLHTQSLNYLNRIKASLEDSEVEINCIVDERDPGHCIAHEAGKDPDTLIAISTQGRLGIGRLALGSVMDQVLRTADRPLLVIRPRDENTHMTETEVRLKSILVPLDGSSLAEEWILPHVVALSKALELTVIMLTVSSERDEPTARVYLQKVREQLSQQGITSVQEMVRSGQPGNNIIAVAGEIEDSLIAITTHGRSGVGRVLRREGDTLMIGSIADRVIRHSNRPVLVVRPH